MARFLNSSLSLDLGRAHPLVPQQGHPQPGLRILRVLTVTEPHKALEILNANFNPPEVVCKTGTVGTRNQVPYVQNLP